MGACKAMHAWCFFVLALFHRFSMRGTHFQAYLLYRDDLWSSPTPACRFFSFPRGMSSLSTRW